MKTPRSTLVRRAVTHGVLLLLGVGLPALALAAGGPVKGGPGGFPKGIPLPSLVPKAMHVRGTITCDNYYDLYTADCECSGSLTKQGGGCDWRKPTTYNFLTNDRFLYIVCWSDHSVAQGLLHDLTINGDAVPSGSPGWQVYPTGLTASSCATAPTAAKVRQQICLATTGNLWKTPAVGQANVASPAPNPWGYFAAIATTAKWTWYDSGLQSGTTAPFKPGFDHKEFLIFRAPLGHAEFTITGEVGCDNYHAVYTSDRDTGAGATVTAIGGGCTWTPGTSYSFKTKDRYLVIAAWSDDATAQGLVHDLAVNAVPAFSGGANWRVATTNHDLDTCVAPLPAAIAADFAAAPAYGPPSYGFSNATPAGGNKVWAPIANIAGNAVWMWANPTGAAFPAPFKPGADHGEYLLFVLDLYGCLGLALPVTYAVSLEAEPASLSAMQGGTQQLRLDAGPDQAGRSYVVLGSASGTEPGLALGAGLLPLNPDGYFFLTLNAPLGAMQGFQGTLDAYGRARASLTIRGGDPTLIGLMLHHVFVVPDTGFASNPVSLEILP